MSSLKLAQSVVSIKKNIFKIFILDRPLTIFILDRQAGQRELLEKRSLII